MMLHVTLKKVGRAAGRDATVLFATSGKEVHLDDAAKKMLSPSVLRATKQQMSHRKFTGEEKQILTTPGSGKNLVVVVGLGPLKKIHQDTVRLASAHVLAALRTLRVQTADVLVPAFLEPRLTLEQALVGVTEGMLLAHYKFNKYQTKSKADADVTDVRFCLPAITKDARNIFEQTQIVVAGTLFARDLVNDHSDVVNPQAFAQTAKEIAQTHKLKSTIFNEKQLAQKGLNLITAVGRGSQFAPRLVLLEYRGDPQSSDTTAIVGKGVTFDTGGVNLKPSQGGMLEEMHCDMAGAAAVLGTMKVLAELKIPVNVIGAMPLAENAISGSAYKPGSIVKAYDGTAVEVENTDAEGRLILGDAIAYVVKNFNPSRVIDIATLTGVCLYAFSDVMSGVVSNDEKTVEELMASGGRTYERLWRLPLVDEYRRMIKGHYGGDINNMGPKFAGVMTAAAFLEHFAKKVPWTHIDASSATQHSMHPYLPRRGTGFGVRLFVDYFLNSVKKS